MPNIGVITSNRHAAYSMALKNQGGKRINKASVPVLLYNDTSLQHELIMDLLITIKKKQLPMKNEGQVIEK